MAPIVASWGPAANRVAQFLQGAPMGPMQVRGDLEVIRGSSIMEHPDWKRDVARAERMLGERRAAVAVPVRRHYTPEQTRERWLRHESNIAARVLAQQAMPKGPSPSADNHRRGKKK